MKSKSFIEYPYSVTLCIDMNHMTIANVSGIWISYQVTFDLFVCILALVQWFLGVYTWVCLHEEIRNMIYTYIFIYLIYTSFIYFSYQNSGYYLPTSKSYLQSFNLSIYKTEVWYPSDYVLIITFYLNLGLQHDLYSLELMETENMFYTVALKVSSKVALEIWKLITWFFCLIMPMKRNL